MKTMEIKINPFSCYSDDYSIMSTTENISAIADKMIRLAAKLTERFASDIFYDIEALHKAIKESEPFDRLLFFRENGITDWQTEKLDVSVFDSIKLNFNVIQTWRLIHNPTDMETQIMRVTISKEGII